MRQIKSFINDAAIQAAVDDKSLGKPYVALDEQTGLIDWNGKEESYNKQYLTIQALENGNFTISKESYFSEIGYSVNNGEWQSATKSKTLSLNEGDKVRVRITANKEYSTKSGLFANNTIRFKVFGNIESLEYGDDFYGKPIKYQYAFKSLFKGCSGLVDASNLILPSETSFQSHYEMFRGCSNMVSAPELTASIVYSGAFASLFFGCTSLNHIKCLSTTFNYVGALNSWVTGVSPTGTFVKKAGVNWPTGDSGIPSNWTVIEE